MQVSLQNYAAMSTKILKKYADPKYCGDGCYAKNFVCSWLSSIVWGSTKLYLMDKHISH